MNSDISTSATIKKLTELKIKENDILKDNESIKKKEIELNNKIKL
jgi:hypothetical protein